MSLHGASILVTGGTGSFGKAFVRYATTYLDPKRLVIYSRDEQKQWTMAQEYTHPSLRFFVGDIRDRSRLELAMRGIEYVIHAAALKIIPTAEYNPTETIATNVIGTQNVAMAALYTGVRKVVGLSTDKAANPCTLYGSTKLCAEKILVAYNSLSGDGGCTFGAVRYGNIAFSRGSVIPHFQKQKAQGVALSITHPDMTRFYYTLDQAVALVMGYLDHGNRGEIHVPIMPSFRIVDLAEAIDPGNSRKFIGIRGSEKIHEDIITSHELRARKGGIYVISPDGISGDNVSSGQNTWMLSVADLVTAVSQSHAEAA